MFKMLSQPSRLPLVRTNPVPCRGEEQGSRIEYLADLDALGDERCYSDKWPIQVDSDLVSSGKRLSDRPSATCTAQPYSASAPFD